MDYKQIVDNLTPEQKQKLSEELLKVLHDPNHSTEEFDAVFKKHVGFTISEVVEDAIIKQMEVEHEQLRKWATDSPVGSAKVFRTK